MNDKWWADQDAVSKKMGIQYDKDLIKKYPDINASSKENNGGMCLVCYCDFDNDAVSCICGHQFCEDCWTGMLKSKVLDGSECVFVKCQQLRCNVTVPHSFYSKFLKDEVVTAEMPSGEMKEINYLQIYKDWHAEQYID